MTLQQRALFDRVAAADARERAIEQVARHAAPDWKRDALAAVARRARAVPFLTTDDVWRLAPCTTHEPRAMGAVMRQAAALGLVEATDRYLQSDRVACHRRPLRVWRSLVCGSSTAAAGGAP